MAYSSAVERALALAAERHGVDPSLLRSFVAIESGGNPSNVTGSYRGLMQLSPQEFARYGGRGDIHDPEANAVAGAAKIAAESAAFQQKYGRTPTAADIYLIHQQGEGGAAAHWANPEAPAWQNMLSTGEGKQKGEGWARQAIWGNLPDAEKRRFGSVDNVTSKDFTDFWNSRVARAGGGDGSSNAIAGLGAAAAATAVSSSDASNPVTLADASGPSDAPLFLGSAPSSKIEHALKLADAVSPKQQMLRPVDILHPTQSLGGGASEGLKMAQASGITGGRTFASGGAVDDEITGASKSAGIATAREWALNPPIVPEQRGYLVPGRIPAHVSGTDRPNVELAVPGIIQEPIDAWARMVRESKDQVASGNIDPAKMAEDAFTVASSVAMGGGAAPKPKMSAGTFGGKLDRMVVQFPNRGIPEGYRIPRPDDVYHPYINALSKESALRGEAGPPVDWRDAHTRNAPLREAATQIAGDLGAYGLKIETPFDYYDDAQRMMGLHRAARIDAAESAAVVPHEVAKTADAIGIKSGLGGKRLDRDYGVTFEPKPAYSTADEYRAAMADANRMFDFDRYDLLSRQMDNLRDGGGKIKQRIGAYDVDELEFDPKAKVNGGTDISIAHDATADDILNWMRLARNAGTFYSNSDRAAFPGIVVQGAQHEPADDRFRLSDRALRIARAEGGSVSEPVDTGSNVPESLESLLAQQKQLIEGRRPAQMYPLGTRELPLPSGMERVQLPRGVYHYNPKLISPERIASASMSGRENDILGLGPLSKNDVLAQARATGESPVVVTERDPFGAELKASLATPSTARVQADEIAQSKAPDSSIGLEPVDGVVGQRSGGGGMIDRALRLAVPRKAEGGGLSDPIDAEFTDVDPGPHGLGRASVFSDPRYSDPTAETFAGKMPDELRGQGLGESRDPHPADRSVLTTRELLRQFGSEDAPMALMGVGPGRGAPGVGSALFNTMTMAGPIIAGSDPADAARKKPAPEPVSAPPVGQDEVLKAIGGDPALTSLYAQLRQAQADANNPELYKSIRAAANERAIDLQNKLNLGIEELTKAQRPFDKAHPDLSANWPAIQALIPGIAGFATKAIGDAITYSGKAPWRRALREAQRAAGSGDIAAEAAATEKLRQYVGDNPGVMRQIADGTRDTVKALSPTIAGAVAGAEASLYPDQHNLRNTPKGTPAHDRAEDVLSPQNIAANAGRGALIGALGGFGGQHLSPTYATKYPLAESKAFMARSATEYQGGIDRLSSSVLSGQRANELVQESRRSAGDAAATALQQSQLNDEAHRLALEAVQQGPTKVQQRQFVGDLLNRNLPMREPLPANPPLPSAALPNPASNSPLLPSPLQSNGAGSVPQGAASRALALARDPALSEPIGGGAGAAAAKIKWDDAAHGGHARDFLAENAGSLDKLHPVDIARHYESRGVRPPEMKDIEKRLDRTRGLIAHTIAERKAAGLSVGEKDIADIIRRLPAGVGIDAKGKVIDPLLGIGAGIAGGSALSNGGGEAQGDADAGLFASGGAVAKALKLAGHPVVNQPARGPHLPHVGPIMGASPGRADHVPMAVPAGAHVVPADIVSSLGQGNTHAGMNVLSKMFRSGPYGVPAKPTKLAEGGAVPIMASDGEFVIDPAMVAEIGGGDPNYGHDVLDQWILNARHKAIETMQNLAPPATD